MAKAGNVISMPGAKDLPTPWGTLGFESEREMLLDDLKAFDGRIKDSGTAAHAIAALSKRKQEVLEQIKRLDSSDDELDEILDDSEDEAFGAG